MPEKASTKTARKRRKRTPRISYKKEIARETTGTSLWVADHALFHEIAGRRHTTPAELLREIVHNWAITIRVSGQAKDTLEMAGPIRKLHQQIVSEQLTEHLGPVLAILRQMSTLTPPLLSPNANTSLVPAEQQDSALLTLLKKLVEELESTKEELRLLKAFATAHYMLSGQNFAATWATLDFLQRYIVSPALKANPAHEIDHFEASITHRDDARLEGQQMVEQMCLSFHYPAEYPFVLIKPEEDQS